MLGAAVAKFDGAWVESNFAGDHGKSPFPTDGVLADMTNRDETVWGPDAEEFDLFREHHQHVAFAHGVHMCLGMHLARLEMRLSLNLLFDELPDIELDPATLDDTFVDGHAFRSPNQLKVRF